ncbi:MAG TPA: winged helix-turn-helix domain-containing protein [Dokdonella sp.]
MSTFVFDAFRLDAATRELRRGGERVALPPRVFACLLFLIERRERAVGRDELIAAMWDGRSASDVQLAQLILQCRRAVDDDGQQQRAIRTVAGYGYRWVAPLAEHTGADAPALVASPAPSSAAAADAIAADAGTAATRADSAPAARSAPTLRRGAAAVALALASCALLAFALVAVRRGAAPSAPPAATVLVAPIRVDDADARWLRLGGMDVVVERLRRNGVPVVSSEATVAMLQAIGAPAAADPTALARHARAAAGAGAIVDIAARRDGAGWRMTASLRGGDGERELAASAADPLAALADLGDRLSGALGHAPAGAVAAGAGAKVALTLQQARAALLANEVERARALLESEPGLVADQPLLRQQLAEVDIRAGRYAEARATLDALLAAPTGDAALRAELLDSRGVVDVRSGRFAEAGADFSAALASLGEHGDAITRGRAYLGRGISRTSLQDYAGALADYARARAAFERAGDAGWVARVDTDVGALEILRGHVAQAEPYLQRAVARFRDLGFVQERVNALQHLYVTARAQLHEDAARAAIEELEGLDARIVSPSSRWSVGLYRADWLLWRGRLADARAQLDALAETARPAAASEAERLHLTRAALERSAGDAAAALAELAAVADAELPSADDDSVRAEVGLLRARLQRELGSAGDAPPPAAQPSGIVSPNPRTPLRLLADADRALARGDAEAAERAFKSALALADEQGVPATVAAATVDYADHLIAAGRVDEAAGVAGRVALWAGVDYDCALLRLRLAHAAGRRDDWAEALAAVRRLAGERRVPAELAQPP